VFQAAFKIKSPMVGVVGGLHMYQEIFGDFVPAGPKAAPAAFGPEPEVITAM
jgi:hypothetical protein